MTDEELEKATGQELIEARDYCGVDGYYRDYLNNVNAEMLNRFNRLVILEKENEELKERLLQEREIYWCKGFECAKKKYDEQLTKAKELLKDWFKIARKNNTRCYGFVKDTEAFLKED